jgi:hypothetical protein
MAPIAKSMAPPTAGIASAASVCQWRDRRTQSVRVTTKELAQRLLPELQLTAIDLNTQPDIARHLFGEGRLGREILRFVATSGWQNAHRPKSLRRVFDL